jgi:hypothetical protein
MLAGNLAVVRTWIFVRNDHSHCPGLLNNLRLDQSIKACD